MSTESRSLTQVNEDIDLWNKLSEQKYKNIKKKIDINSEVEGELFEKIMEENQTKKKVIQAPKEIKNEEEFVASKESNILPSVQKIIYDINKNLKGINQIKDELSNINSLYFENKADIMKQKLEGKLELPFITNSKGEKEIIEPTDEEIEAKQQEMIIKRKKNKTLNIKKTNEDYRRQLANAFFNFNPLIHLSNLKMLQKIDPEINLEIQRLSKRIDKDLLEVTDKHYYSKQYQNIILENEKIRKKRKEKLEKFAKTEGNLSTKARTEETEGNLKNKEEKKLIKGNPKVIETKTYSRRKKKNIEVVRRKFPDRDLEIKNMQLMKNCLFHINKSISPESIERYFSQSETFETEEELEKQKKNYFPGIIKGFEMLKEIQENKIIKNLNLDNLNKKRVLTENNEDFLEYLNTRKQGLLEGIGNFEN